MEEINFFSVSLSIASNQVKLNMLNLATSILFRSVVRG